MIANRGDAGGPLQSGVLARAMRRGAAALPDDLHRLQANLRLIDELLAEKALEHEPTWTMAEANAAEIETLQKLERVVVLKATETHSEGLPDVLVKLAMWEALAAGCDEGDEAPVRDRLIHSVKRDLQGLLREDTVRHGSDSA